MLTNLQRKSICEAQASLHMGQAQLAEWAKSEFKLKKCPSQATICLTLKKRKTYESMELIELAAKRPRILKHPQLDRAIANWIIECESRQAHISYEIIRCKALDFANLLHIEPTPKFSNGWLEKFVKRHGFLKFKSHGESGSVNVELLKRAMPPLQTKIALFPPSDVYNMDETGLFYSQAPASRAPEISHKITEISHKT